MTKDNFKSKIKDFGFLGPLSIINIKDIYHNSAV